MICTDCLLEIHFQHISSTYTQSVAIEHMNYWIHNICRGSSAAIGKDRIITQQPSYRCHLLLPIGRLLSFGALVEGIPMACWSCHPSKPFHISFAYVAPSRKCVKFWTLWFAERLGLFKTVRVPLFVVMFGLSKEKVSIAKVSLDAKKR